MSSWVSNRENLEKAFNYAKTHNVEPLDLAKKFGITLGESTIIIEWLSWDRFAELKLEKQK